jgi:hypothetical protein
MLTHPISKIFVQDRLGHITSIINFLTGFRTKASPKRFRRHPGAIFLPTVADGTLLAFLNARSLACGHAGRASTQMFQLGHSAPIWYVRSMSG